MLVGEVIARPGSKELLLITENADPRVSAIRIPIEKGKFYHEWEAAHREAYTLIFTDEFENGAWRRITFFSEPDTLRFILYPADRFVDNIVRGGELNQHHVAFNRNMEDRFGLYTLEKRQKQLVKEDRYFTKEAMALREALQRVGSGPARDSLQGIAQALDRRNGHLTAEAAELTALFRAKQLEWLEWKTEQVVSRPSLVTYRELVALLNMSTDRYSEPLPISVPELLVSFEKQYRPRYPGHPYTRIVEAYLTAVDRIRVGGEYIDFTAPDLSGNPVTLSQRIKGKIAVINLWASWCGPCRRKGIELIPVYEEYRDSGFEVVGVAREMSGEAGVRAARMDGYPWLNLLEINDTQRIWEQYGLGNSGGGVFLVDEKGIILAMSPTAEEVRAILAERRK